MTTTMTLHRRPAPHAQSEPAGGRDLDLVVHLAHDLRSPLAAILIMAEAMREGKAGTVSDTQRRQLGLIYNAALSLCSAANDVMELARGGQQLVEPRPTPYCVSEVLASVRDMVSPMAEEKDIQLVVTAPQTASRLGHARALSRVLLNLATNALKFTEHGFVEIAAREVDGGGRLEFLGDRYRSGPHAVGRVRPVARGAAPVRGHRAGPQYLPEARGRDGLGAPVRDAAPLRHALLLHARRAAGGLRRVTRSGVARRQRPPLAPDVAPPQLHRRLTT